MTSVMLQLRPDSTAVLPAEFPNGSVRGLTLGKDDTLGSMVILAHFIRHHAHPEVPMRRKKTPESEALQASTLLTDTV